MQLHNLLLYNHYIPGAFQTINPKLHSPMVKSNFSYPCKMLNDFEQNGMHTYEELMNMENK